MGVTPADRHASWLLPAAGLATLASAALALAVRLPEGADLALSLRLHGPRLLLALAAGAGFGVAGALQCAEDESGRGHPLLFAALAGGAFAGALGSRMLGGPTAAAFSVCAAAGALGSALLVFGARRLGGYSRLATGVLLLVFLGVALLAALEAKGDPTGLRPWVLWLLGDLSHATWATAAPAALAILALAGVVARRTPDGPLAAVPEAARSSLLGLAGLLFGLCLGAAGGIAFFALLVALTARTWVGGGSLRRFALAAGLLGAPALVLADTVPRALFGGFAPPAGFAVAAVAVPWLLLRGDGRSPRAARALEWGVALLATVALLAAVVFLTVLAAGIA